MLKRGFTIVELIIVVIVIAILATIITVGYTTVQKNALTAVYADEATKLSDQFSLISAHGDMGKLFGEALLSPDGTPQTNICIGDVSDFPETDDFAEGECVRGVNLDGSSTIYSANAVFAQRMREAGFQWSNNLPVVNYRQSGTEAKARGVVLSVIGGKPYFLTWYTPDQAGCGRGNGVMASVIEVAHTNEAYRQGLIDQYGEDWEEVLGGGSDGCLLSITDSV